jgi:serralysin
VASNTDRIADYQVGVDVIVIENAVFRALVGLEAVLGEEHFWVGRGAATAETNIIYNPSTGTLTYDSNGTGAGGAIVFATLARGLDLTHGDFLII